jgi:hypothetical protein
MSIVIQGLFGPQVRDRNAYLVKFIVICTAPERKGVGASKSKKEYIPYALSEGKTKHDAREEAATNKHEQNVLARIRHGARRACRVGALPLN